MGGASVTRRVVMWPCGNSSRTRASGTPRTSGLRGLFTVKSYQSTAPPGFVQHFTVFMLSCIVGWQVIWSVNHALHTPLMSVTNAISGIILVGGVLQAGAEPTSLAGVLGAVAILISSVNIVGGFLVTHRMLQMFRKGA